MSATPAVSNFGQMLVRAGGAEPLDELVIVGGHNRGGEGRERNPARRAPVGEPGHGLSVGIGEAGAEELDRMEGSTSDGTESARGRRAT
jgi:hypothetical protein